MFTIFWTWTWQSLAKLVMVCLKQYADFLSHPTEGVDQKVLLQHA